MSTIVKQRLAPSFILTRKQIWSESIAVGNERFAKDIHQKLAGRDRVCSVVFVNDLAVLKEQQGSYKALFTGQKGVISPENTYLLRSNPAYSIC